MATCWVRTGINGDRLLRGIHRQRTRRERCFPGVRSLLHHEAGRQGNWSGLKHMLWNHHGTRRNHSRKVTSRRAERRFLIELPSTKLSPLLPSPRPIERPPQEERNGRILLVELIRDDSVLEAVGTILRSRDHQVNSAREPAWSAKSFLKKESFDLIVADLHVFRWGQNGGDFGEWLVQHMPALSNKINLDVCRRNPRKDTGEDIAGKRPSHSTKSLSRRPILLGGGGRAAAKQRSCRGDPSMKPALLQSAARSPSSLSARFHSKRLIR